jgi:hypothetical protein
MNILLSDFIAKVGREGVSKPTFGNDGLHVNNDDNGVRVMSKTLTVRNTLFPHHNINKYTSTSPNGKSYRLIDYVMTERQRPSSALDVQPFSAANCGTDHYLVVVKVWERLTINKQRSNRFHMDRFIP